MKELDVENECRTVGELKKLIEDMPDDWVLITPSDYGEAEDVTHVNTYWHGALTFERAKRI